MSGRLVEALFVLEDGHSTTLALEVSCSFQELALSHPLAVGVAAGFVVVCVGSWPVSSSWAAEGHVDAKVEAGFSKMGLQKLRGQSLVILAGQSHIGNRCGEEPSPSRGGCWHFLMRRFLYCLVFPATCLPERRRVDCPSHPPKCIGSCIPAAGSTVWPGADYWCGPEMIRWS